MSADSNKGHKNKRNPRQITDKSQQLLQTSRLMIAAQHDGSALRQTRLFFFAFIAYLSNN